MNKDLFPRVNMLQVLDNKHSRAVVWYAVILDPETGKRLASTPIWYSEPNAYVELALERETVA